MFVNGVASNFVPFTVTPTITNVSPPFGAVGDSIAIPGTNFGNLVPGDTVTFNGTPATIQSWIDTGATVLVPSGATTGPLVVTAGGFASNSFNFTVSITPDTLSWVVQALHNEPLGVCDVPCITDEGLFVQLITLARRTLSVGSGEYCGLLRTRFKSALVTVDK